MNKSIEDKFTNSVILLGLIAVGNLLCGLILFTMAAVLGNTTDLSNTLVIWISIGIGFCFIPYCVVKKLCMASLKSLGIVRPALVDISIIICAVVCASAINVHTYLTGNSQGLMTSFTVMIQQLGVAIGEEFFTRGIVIFMLQRIVRKKTLVLILSSIIFGFLMHTGSDLLANMIIRVPAGFLLGALYMKTGKIWAPVAIHWIYNVLCIIII